MMKPLVQNKILLNKKIIKKIQSQINLFKWENRIKVNYGKNPKIT
jgi:hypothetical protein